MRKSLERGQEGPPKTANGHKYLIQKQRGVFDLYITPLGTPLRTPVNTPLSIPFKYSLKYTLKYTLQYTRKYTLK